MSLVIDRVTASRLGIAPTTIDNTLYDAFGQRQINTMYTQLNQYHVIMEAQPQFQQEPDKLDHIYIQANAAAGTTGAGASSSSGMRIDLGGVECTDGDDSVHAFGGLADAAGQRAYVGDDAGRRAPTRPASHARYPAALFL